MPDDVAKRFLPQADYARAGTVDYGQMAAVQEAFSAQYLREVK
jgi:putative spermidine/putrescine transport system substrate-binding protein